MAYRLSPDLVNEMYAKYQAGASLYSLSKEYQRERASIRQVFRLRGFTLRPNTVSSGPQGAGGRWLAYKQHTPAEITAILQRAPKLALPDELRSEWRKWSLAQQADIVRRLRVRFPSGCPSGPLSAGLVYFDWGSERAHAIINEQNKGLPSRHHKGNIRLCSEGVIFEGELWFWKRRYGYGNGLAGNVKVLHWHLWERANQRPVPPQYVVRFADGNWNNHAPENLILESRNGLCRENQAAALTRKSRNLLATLLNRKDQPERKLVNELVCR